MTQILPESSLGPVVTKPFVDGFATIEVITEEAQKVKFLEPELTVWGRPAGRPIYDRLPGVSQGYRLDFFGERDLGYVYIDPQYGRTFGPGSLLVGSWERDASVVVIENGTITWRHGQVEANALALDLRNVVEDGVPDGEYYVGYYLSYVNEQESDFISEYAVKDSSLAATTALFQASRYAENHPATAAFSEISDGTWLPTDFGYAGTYAAGTSLVIDFTKPLVEEEFVLKGGALGYDTATCALYRSNDGICWYFETQTKATNNEWRLLVSSEQPWRYWRIFFWGGAAEVSEITFTGVAVFRSKYVSTGVSVLEPFLEEIEPNFNFELPHALLAGIEVRNKQVVGVADYRQITSIKYEPVASWLTDFQDTSLKSLFDGISNYSDQYMAPPTAADVFYPDLLAGGIPLGNDVDRDVIRLPSSISLEEPHYLTGDPALLITPSLDELATDPNAIVIEGQNVKLYGPDSIVLPRRVILLAEPLAADDLATAAYSNIILTPSLDNGNF
jgi:hypothetical protein